MRRTSSEIIRSLEVRVARLEKQSARIDRDVRQASEGQLIYLNEYQSDLFDLDYYQGKGETFTVHTEALLRTNQEYDSEHKDFFRKNEIIC